MQIFANRMLKLLDREPAEGDVLLELYKDEPAGDKLLLNAYGDRIIDY